MRWNWMRAGGPVRQVTGSGFSLVSVQFSLLLLSLRLQFFICYSQQQQQQEQQQLYYQKIYTMFWKKKKNSQISTASRGEQSLHADVRRYVHVSSTPRLVGRDSRLVFLQAVLASVFSQSAQPLRNDEVRQYCRLACEVSSMLTLEACFSVTLTW